MGVRAVTSVTAATVVVNQVKVPMMMLSDTNAKWGIVEQMQMCCNKRVFSQGVKVLLCVATKEFLAKA